MECIKRTISILAVIFFQSFFSFAAVWDIQTLEDDIKHEFDTNVDIAVDSNSVPHIIYFKKWQDNEDLSLVHAYLPGETWQETIILYKHFTIGTCHPKACIAIDSNDVLFVAYTYFDSDNNKDDLYYTSKTAQGWAEPEFIDDPGQCMIHDMAVDSNGLLHIVYRRIPLDCNFEDANLVLAVGLGESFTPHLIRDSGYYLSASIAIDSFGYDHIAYYEETNNCHIRHAVFDYNSVSDEMIENLQNPAGFTWGSTSIAIDSNDRPCVSYRHFIDSDFKLKYASKPASDWLIETVDANGTAGKYSSMAVDSNNHPHIAYRHSENSLKTVRYALRNTAEWPIEIVKDTNEHVKYMALDIDSSDKLHLCYVIPSKKTVEYATVAICGDEEYPYPQADINKNCYVDIHDLTLFAQKWAESGCGLPDYCGGADLDKKGTVDLNDLAIIEETWLDCSMPYCN